MEVDDFVECFEEIQQAQDLSSDGYKNSWYDVDDDPVEGMPREFTIEIPEEGSDIYISVESYYSNMHTEHCHLDQHRHVPDTAFTITKGAKVLANITRLSTAHPWYYHLKPEHYSAGTVLSMTTKFNWHWQLAARDYSIVVYAKQNVTIKDSGGKTNMLHYDGQSPSGFTGSRYRTEQTGWTPNFSTQRVTSLPQLLRYSTSISDFISLFLINWRSLIYLE